MINLQTVQSTPRTNILKPLVHWLEPRSASRDEAFRERTIRITSGILIVVMALSLLTSLTIFNNTWTLVSFPSMITLILAFCVASAIAVSQGRVTLAGSLLVTATLVANAGVAQLAGYWGFLVPPVGMLVILLTALTLPRQALFPMVAVVLLMYSAITLLGFYVTQQIPPVALGQPTPTPWQYITDNVFVFVIEAFFLRQLRVEFDGRLSATTAALTETQAARQEAEKANKAKSQFLANMSHELRTPLNAVIGYAEIMLGGLAGTFTAEQTKLIESIQKNARRLLNLINDILDLSRVESGRIELHPEPVSPKTVLTDLTATLQSLADKKNLKLELTFSPNTPSTVIIDSAKLQQITVNLLGNALKFTKQGKIELLTDSKTFDTWEFKVRDTGIGIPAEAISTIFDVFQQVDSTDSRQYEGTGLGLAIVKTLVEHMGGTVTVQSTVGVGTTFTVTLPKTMRTN